MKRTKRNLELFHDRVPRSFGGAALKSNPKQARPLSTKHSIHLILKSEIALGKRSLLHPNNAKMVEALIRKQAKRFGVRLYHLVNVGNHLHLVLRLPKLSPQVARRAYFAFVRAITGLIPRLVLRAQKGSPQKIRFWQARPFTRLVSWGRDFKEVSRYMEKNAGQALSLIIDFGFDLSTPDSTASPNSS